MERKGFKSQWKARENCDVRTRKMRENEGGRVRKDEGK